MIDAPPFQVSGALYPRSPVIVSVAHAGRDYPPDLLDIARVPIDALRGLEDVHADALIAQAAAEGATTVVATLARAAIDLNRDPREVDPGMIYPLRHDRPFLQTQKVRGGLGLVPRRLASCGELWRRPLSEAEIDDRIATVHEPYHRAIAAALDAARATYGAAVLIDCHSMPSLPVKGLRRPQIVLGDRFGRSAAPQIIDGAIAVLASSGVVAGRNQPYAGGYTLDRHGRPANDVHAVQIEFDRALYLDGEGRPIAEGVMRCGRILAELAQELASRIVRDMTIAAE